MIKLIVRGNDTTNDDIKFNDKMITFTDDQNEQKFDKVYQSISNRTLYTNEFKNQVDKFNNNINSLVMTYGQTGSGKTFTIFGKKEFQNGIIYDMIEDINFDSTNQQYRIQIQEIQNEKIYNLIDETIDEQSNNNIHPSPNKDNLLSQKEQEDNCFQVEKSYSIKSKKDIINQVKKADEKRTESVTKFNTNSSRSHLFINLLKFKISNINIFKINKQVSKLSVIDLAGSEKFDNQNENEQKNGGKIRQSLLNLKLFISSLRTSEGNIQCRNTLLTKLIKDTVLCTKCDVIVIINIHTGKDHISDSKQTLKDAIQFKNIDQKFKKENKLQFFKKHLESQPNLNSVENSFYQKEYNKMQELNKKLMEDLRKKSNYYKEKIGVIVDRTNEQMTESQCSIKEYENVLKSKDQEIMKLENQLINIKELVDKRNLEDIDKFRPSITSKLCK